MGDALVTVDAGLAGGEGVQVLLAGPGSLELRVHGFEIVTVAALAGVGLLHHLPHPFGHGQPMLVELLGGVHGTQYLMVDLVAGLDLTHHLVHPGVGDMAVGAGGADAGAVGVVDGGYVLLIDVLFHLVTAYTKFQVVGRLHGGVEATPENYAGDKGQHRTADRGAEDQPA